MFPFYIEPVFNSVIPKENVFRYGKTFFISF